MLTEPENNASCLIDIFCEFVEIAVHNILYIRKLYPETIFEATRKYGAIVHHSVQPGVNEYILNCLNAIRFHLKGNQLRSVLLCFNSHEKIVEKYRFKIFNITSCFESDPFLVKLEEYLRNFCLKLNSAVNHLDKLPRDCFFTIQLEVTEYSNLEYSQNPSHENFLWVDTEKNVENLNCKIIPLHTIDTDFVNMQIYVEQFC